ncbi:hypothetical protein LJC36_06480, partial [Desulfovibrio sp. OttesenSCG-928-C14]|nr:hypothetical protein [Desulfovibrio sp. OttesenSCG-928-C14]
DSLPFAKALEEGWRKLVVVKTRDTGYRKKPNPAALRLLLRKMYGEYPDLVETMAARPEMYNGQLGELRGLEREGRAFVIEPQEPVDIGRTETDPEKLRLLYEAARAQTRGLLPGLREFLA